MGELSGWRNSIFRGQDNNDLDALWRSYLTCIEEDITELRFLRRSLQQRIEMFDNMRNGVSNVPCQDPRNLY